MISPADLLACSGCHSLDDGAVDARRRDGQNLTAAQLLIPVQESSSTRSMYGVPATLSPKSSFIERWSHA